MAKMATMAFLATATHADLMATSAVADILMVHDDDGVGVVSNPEHAVRTAVTLRYTPLIDRRTQYHPLSATINNRASHGTNGGTGSIVLVAVAHAEHDSAPMC